jgi:hypothetical protein
LFTFSWQAAEPARQWFWGGISAVRRIDPLAYEWETERADKARSVRFDWMVLLLGNKIPDCLDELLHINIEARGLIGAGRSSADLLRNH